MKNLTCRWFLFVFSQSIGKPLFVSPSAGEENANGARAFACLRDSMIRKDVVMIGELLSKPGTVSRLVALSPWIPLPGLDVQPPPGMIARLLPYREELRDTTEAASGGGSAPLVSDELLKKTSKLVKKLTYKENETPEIGKDFTNAQMDKLYNYIERVALCEPEPPQAAEQCYDTLFTKEYRKERSAKYKGLIAAIEQVLPKDERPKEKAGRRKSAPPPKDRKSAAPKGRKRSREVAANAGVDWISLYHESAGDLNCKVWTVVMLRAYCKEVGLSQGGKKKDLAFRATPYIKNTVAEKERSTQP
jgi:non-homologous end joining protein Ku